MEKITRRKGWDGMGVCPTPARHLASLTLVVGGLCRRLPRAGLGATRPPQTQSETGAVKSPLTRPRGDTGGGGGNSATATRTGHGTHMCSCRGAPHRGGLCVLVAATLCTVPLATALRLWASLTVFRDHTCLQTPLSCTRYMSSSSQQPEGQARQHMQIGTIPQHKAAWHRGSRAAQTAG